MYIKIGTNDLKEIMTAARDYQAELLNTSIYSKNETLADGAWERHERLNKAMLALTAERERALRAGT
jgi:hypothetical protein